MRLVIDLSRSVNKYLQSCKLKYEGWLTLSEMFEKEFCIITFDLEPGYYGDPQVPRQKRKARGKKEKLAAKKKSSRQNGKARGKMEKLAAKKKTSRQKKKTSRQKRKPRGGSRSGRS